MLSHDELVSEVHQLELSHEMVTEELFEVKKKLESAKEYVNDKDNTEWNNENTHNIRFNLKEILEK